MRKVISISLLAVTLFMLGCPKSTALRNAQIVLDGVKAAAPIISTYLPNDAALVTELTNDAQKVKDALAVNDTSTALTALTALIPVFEQIISDTHGLPTSTQTAILAALALVDIALHVLVDLLTPAQLAALPGASSASKGSLAAFKVERVWGKDFKK